MCEILIAPDAKDGALKVDVTAEIEKATISTIVERTGERKLSGFTSGSASSSTTNPAGLRACISASRSGSSASLCSEKAHQVVVLLEASTSQRPPSF